MMLMVYVRFHHVIRLTIGGWLQLVTQLSNRGQLFSIGIDFMFG